MGSGGAAGGAAPALPDTPVRVEDIVWRRDTSHLFGASFFVPGTWVLEPGKAPASVEFRCPRGEAVPKTFKVFVADLSAVTSKGPQEKLEELVAHYKAKAQGQVRWGVGGVCWGGGGLGVAAGGWRGPGVGCEVFCGAHLRRASPAHTDSLVIGAMWPLVDVCACDGACVDACAHTHAPTHPYMCDV